MPQNIDEGYDTEESEQVDITLTEKQEKSSFILSPADIEVHRKAT